MEDRFCRSTAARLLARALLLPALLGGVELASAAQPAFVRSEREHVAVRSSVTSLDRASVVDIQGLDNSALRLTSRQRAAIEESIKTYLAEHNAVAEKHPAIPGKHPTAEAIIARQAALVRFNSALSKIMSDEQRLTWKKAQASRLGPRDPNGGFRPPGR